MAGEQEAQGRQREDEVRKVMALNTPENITRLLQKLIEAINAGRDIGSLVAEVGLDNDDAQLVIKTLKKRIRNVRTISKLSKEINELELNIQGTSTSEQNRIARDLASRRASSNKRKMSFYENLGGLGYKLDARGNLIEASRYDYLRQKYYNRYAEFGDDGEVENQSEASRIASILARRQVRNEREEEERKRQAKIDAETSSRYDANRLARERYIDAKESISDPLYMRRKKLYQSFLEVDPQTGTPTPQQQIDATRKAREILRLNIEKQANEFVKNNSKETGENTKALSILNKRLFPFLSYFMPASILGMGTSVIKSDVSTSRAGLSYRNFTEAYLRTREGKEKYKSFEDMYFAQGGRYQEAQKAFSREADWVSGVRFGYGTERIRDLAKRGLRIPSEVLRTGDISGLMNYYARVIPNMSPKEYADLKSSGLLDETMLFGFRNLNRPWGSKERVSHLAGSSEKYLETKPFGERGSWLGEQIANSIGYWMGATFPSWVLSAPNMTPTLDDMFKGRFFYDPYEDPSRRITVNPTINQTITVGSPEEANRISAQQVAEGIVDTLPNKEM